MTEDTTRESISSEVVSSDAVASGSAPSKTQPPGLWTRDFTILTGGSVVSMMGSIISGFAMGLLVLDYTGSTFFYALFMFLNTAPKIIMPVIAGPYLDKFSRRRAIYTLDFISGTIYTIYALLMWRGWFSFPVLAIGTVLLGSIDGIYRVSYDSFYPLLITEGNYQKAYSIASMLETMTAFVVPLSAFLYNTIGMMPLLIINAASYLIAATLETQIRQVEKYAETRKDEAYGIKRYIKDFKEGMAYLNQETGLKAVATYFGFNAMQWGLMNVLVLPYFKGNFSNGEYLFIVVGGCAILGRLLGGVVYYKFRMPTQYKFTIALVVYVCTSLLGGFYLFFPLVIMCIMEFIEGLMGVTSYNIRIAATQSYVPDERKGRFNGTFEMLVTAGNTLGQVLAGTLSLFIGERIILGTFGVLSALCAIIVIGRNRKDVAAIYNRDA